jgi:hypothetical protein
MVENRGDAEFQEIGHAGGKMVLKYDQKNNSVAVHFAHCSPGGCAAIQMGVSLDGRALEFWPLRGVGIPVEPSPMVSVLVISDRERMWGRTCPSRGGYFRTDQPGEVTICPYCAYHDCHAAFTTKNQRLFIDRIRQGYIEAWKGKKDIALELDQIADSLPENRPSWAYNEERQQNRFICQAPKCGARYDVLGEYAGCPACGHRNTLQVFEGHMAELEQKLAAAIAASSFANKAKTPVEWELLTHCFSDFEAMARDVQHQLALVPATPRRKREIEAMSFQRLQQAHEHLQNWFGINILNDINAVDSAFLFRLLARRHLFIHNGGRVDQKYLDQTGDDSVRLHQQLKVFNYEMERLLTLLRKCAVNLFENYKSISLPE